MALFISLHFDSLIMYSNKGFLVCYFVVHLTFSCNILGSQEFFRFSTRSFFPYKLFIVIYKLLVRSNIVNFFFCYSIKHKSEGDCSADSAMGIPVKFEGTAKLEIMYSYSVIFLVS